MIKDSIRRYVTEALNSIDIEISDVFVDAINKNNGDYYTNVAMVYAKSIGKNPKDIASEIVEILEKKHSDVFAKVEMAGPGFINFYLTDGVIESALSEVEKPLHILKNNKINIEFISANPTGSLHIGHGRGAFYGDVLSNILEFAGATVIREFYINDSKESAQIKELGKTALGKGEQYKTEELSGKMENIDFSGMGEGEAGFILAKAVQEDNKNFVENKLGIKFDVWYSEDERLRESGLAEQTLESLRDKDLVYEKDGALWIKTSQFGDDEDRVVVRSDGSMTYFVSDIAYHSDKFGRGYDKVVDVWGADHHGHVKRMRAVHDMLGWKKELLIFITQLVTLREGGEVKKFSKRAGNVILLEDLALEVGVDALRWFFLEKSLNTHMEFDLALARERSSKNPVYYVQYAHARISSILNKIKDLSGDKSSLADIVKSDRGKRLALKIVQFSDVVEDIAVNYQTHKLLTYVYELASEFSQFYRDVKVVKEDNFGSGAVELISMAKRVVAKSLSLLGISAPEKM